MKSHEVKWKSLSQVWLFETPWTAACHVPLSMGFSRPEYWSGLPFPSGHLPNPGIEPRSPTLQVDSLPAEPPGKLKWGHMDELWSDTIHVLIKRKNTGAQAHRKNQVKTVQVHLPAQERRAEGPYPTSTLTSDFWPPEQWENTFLLFETLCRDALLWQPEKIRIRGRRIPHKMFPWGTI